MNRRDELRWHRGRARDAFVRAAAALTEIPTTENLAFAAMEACLGLISIANADEDNRALGLVEQWIQKQKEIT